MFNKKDIIRVNDRLITGNTRLPSEKAKYRDLLVTPEDVEEVNKKMIEDAKRREDFRKNRKKLIKDVIDGIKKNKKK